MMLTNCKKCFQNTESITTGFSDFHKMTVSILKTQFVKIDPIQINHRDYKNCYPINFTRDLRNNLNDDDTLDTNYNRFQKILYNVILDTHAPLKKKSLRANNSPFMTKQLLQMIMNRSRCKHSYHKNQTVGNWERYQKLRNECVKLTKKVKREYYQKLDVNSINDNKTFWKTVKPLNAKIVQKLSWWRTKTSLLMIKRMQK